MEPKIRTRLEHIGVVLALTLALLLAVHGPALWPWKTRGGSPSVLVGAPSYVDGRYVIVPPILSDAPLTRIFVTRYQKSVSGPVRDVLRFFGLVPADKLDGIGTVIVFRSQVTVTPGGVGVVVSEEEKRATADQLASVNPGPPELHSRALRESGTYWTIEWTEGAWRGVLFLLLVYTTAAALTWRAVLMSWRWWLRRRRARRLARGQCPRCAYPLSGAAACPECGQRLGEPGA